MKPPADLPGTPVRYDRVPISADHLTGAARKVFRGLISLYRPGMPISLDGENHNLTNEEGAAVCQVHPSTFRSALAELKSTRDPLTGEPFIAIVGSTIRRCIFIMSRPAQAGEMPVGAPEGRALGRQKGARWGAIVDGRKARAGAPERRALGRQSAVAASSLEFEKGDKTNVNVSRSREIEDGKPDNVPPPAPAPPPPPAVAGPAPEAPRPAAPPPPRDPDEPSDAEVLAELAALHAQPRLGPAERCILVGLRELARERGLTVPPRPETAAPAPAPAPKAQEAPRRPETPPEAIPAVSEPVKPVAPAPRPPDPPRPAQSPPPKAAGPDPDAAIDTETLIRRLVNPSFGDAVVDQVARRIADRLGDEHSLGYHRRICDRVRRGEVPPRRLITAWKLARSPTAQRPGAVFAAAMRDERSMPMRC